MRKVEVLVFEGCPNVEATLAHVRAALAATKEAADVRIVLVDSDEAASRLGFLGSSTVRVDGADVAPSVAARNDYAPQCRVYSVGGRLRGAPPTEWTASALRGDAHNDPASVPRDAPPCKSERFC